MVSITKWIIIGAGMIMLGLFTKEAATTSLTGTLHRTGMAGGSIGSALSGVGSGVGDLMRGLFTPLWEVGNFAKSFGFGSDYWGNSTPDPQAEYQRIELTGQGGGYTDAETQGGGDPGVNTDPVSDHPGWFDQIKIINPIAENVPDPRVRVEQLIPERRVSSIDYTITPSLPTVLTLPSIYGGQYQPPSSADTYSNAGGGVSNNQGGGTWGTNVRTSSGGVTSGNLSLSGWGD